VLRGFTPRGADATWIASAHGGQFMVARQPDRKPGEPYGDVRWENSGVAYIARKKPNELELPATLSNRLSNYDPWIKDSQ
jgi:hypothetical protein